MKTSRYATWTTALTLAIAVGGALGLSRTARADDPTPMHPITIPTTCITIPGGQGFPGRNGLGVLSIPIDPDTRAFIDQCAVGIHANVVGFKAYACDGSTNWREIGKLYSSVTYVKDGAGNWIWQGVPLPECFDAHTMTEFQLGIADSWSTPLVRGSGTIVLTCCNTCTGDPGGPGQPN